MNKLQNFITARATAKNIKLFFILSLINSTFFLFPPFSIFTGPKHLDTTGFYPASQVPQILTQMGEAGRAASNLMHWTIDLTFPFIISTLLVLWITHTWRDILPTNGLGHYINLLPLVSMLADYAENFTSLALIARFPGHSPGLAQAASIFSSLKWSFLIVSIIAGLVGVFRSKQTK